jgi:diguanylate cyclase (GGDEF)-like protein
MGDRLLRTVATTLAETIAAPEIVARLKDDDFVVLLPETSRAGAVTATTRLLASLARVSVFSEGEEQSPITASVAIACFPEDADTALNLLQGAMRDLEQAKRDRPARKDSARASG